MSASAAPKPFIPADFAWTSNFLYILEESGFDVACHQMQLTPADGRALVVWAAEQGNLTSTVVIVQDDPETEDFREPDPGPSPAGRIVGSAPPSAADDANRLTRACEILRELLEAETAFDADKRRHEQVGSPRHPFPIWRASFERLCAAAERLGDARAAAAIFLNEHAHG